MSEAIRWWLVLLVVGAVTLPLCLATFRRLPDRGYTLSKPFALLFLGYTFWFLNSIHVLPNHRGGIIAALMLLGVTAGLFAYREREELRAWAERNWRYIVGVEVAFLVVFMLAVWLRSLVGQISGTEQPMDLMFVNATMRAEHFPPKDPWLSGHDVSYYYFGYLLVGMISTLAGVPSAIGYNIGLGMIASLTLIAAFGIVYNLIRMRQEATGEDQPAAASPALREPTTPRVAAVAGGAQGTRARESIRLRIPPEWRPFLFAAAGALMLVVMGNLVWALKFASAYGIGGDGFYEWIDVSDLTADEQRATWYPSEFFGFFDASRIYPGEGNNRVITEFPMFSFVLGDLHPHVMALPFVLLVVALALSLFRSDEPVDLALWIRRPLLLVAASIMVGALGFLNTWDIATLVFVVVAAAFVANVRRTRSAASHNEPVSGETDAVELDWPDVAVAGAVALGHLALMTVIIAVLRPAPLLAIALVAGNVVWLGLFGAYLSRPRWHWALEALMQTASFAVPLVMTAVVLFIPFYLSFTSQADAILPVVTRPGITEPGTRPVHALLFWGPLFTVVLPFIAARLLAQRDRIVRRDALIALAVPAAIIFGWMLLFAFLNNRDNENLREAGGLFVQIGDRGTGWITALLLGVFLAASLLALWLELTADDDRGERASVVFPLLLASTAFLLIIGTEFFYVDDVFNARMNTVFKLYYQAWVLLALAGGFALYYAGASWRFTFEREPFRHERNFRIGWAAAAAIVLAGAALYPIGATFNRARPYERVSEVDDQGNPVTRYVENKPLRGLDGISRLPAGEREAIAWLTGLARDQRFVIVEAFCPDPDCGGNDYSDASRISGTTGAPTVLGWAGHEDQWRGGDSAARAGRFEDVERLYKTTTMAEVQEIVEKYRVTYIYVGPLERRTYGEEAIAKFGELPIAFRSKQEIEVNGELQPEVVVYQAEANEDEAAATP